jgi:Uma2 family endonuclease
MTAVALRVEDLPHYTYDDYVQWEGRWELIQGIPYAMVPAPVINHQRVIRDIERQLYDLLDNCSKCEVLWTVDWPIAEDTVVQPDLLVVCGDQDEIGVTKLEITPVIVFEVLSPSTSKKDRTLKYRLYEEAGVKYYCIVDIDTKSATIFSLQDQPAKYREENEFKDEKILFDLGPCRIAFDLGKIFSQYY